MNEIKTAREKMKTAEQAYLQACVDYSTAIKDFHTEAGGSKRGTARQLEMSESQVRFHIAKVS